MFLQSVVAMALCLQIPELAPLVAGVFSRTISTSIVPKLAILLHLAHWFHTLCQSAQLLDRSLPLNSSGQEDRLPATLKAQGFLPKSSCYLYNSRFVYFFQCALYGSARNATSRRCISIISRPPVSYNFTIVLFCVYYLIFTNNCLKIYLKSLCNLNILK